MTVRKNVFIIYKYLEVFFGRKVRVVQIVFEELQNKQAVKMFDDSFYEKKLFKNF